MSAPNENVGGAVARRDARRAVEDREAMSAPYLHETDQHFTSLVDYLRHLVDVHGVEESPELWRSGRERFDELHAKLHGAHGLPAEGEQTS